MSEQDKEIIVDFVNKLKKDCDVILNKLEKKVTYLNLCKDLKTEDPCLVRDNNGDIWRCR